MPYIDNMDVENKVEEFTGETGRYIYCVAATGERVSMGNTGIEGNEVYTLPHMDICAVVHDCPVQPYKSDGQEMVKSWIMVHQRVVDEAWKRWDTVLPFSFDTIIKGEGESGAEQNVKNWLKQEYEDLKRKIDKVRDKAEYGVQVFWNPRVIAENMIKTSQEIKKLDEEIKTKSKGLAYMYRQRLDNLMRGEMETRADRCFKDFYQRIRKHADDIRVEKIKKTEQGLQMLMNLSCLVYRDRDKELGEELDQISHMEGFSVRFTGPWPPYSFI